MTRSSELPSNLSLLYVLGPLELTANAPPAPGASHPPRVLSLRLGPGKPGSWGISIPSCRLTKTQDLPVSKQLNSLEEGIVVAVRPMLMVSLPACFLIEFQEAETAR